MTTARGLLRRLIARGRIDQGPSSAGAGPDQRAVENRLDAARQRLKETIPSPEDPVGATGDTAGEPGQATPSSEGVSPRQESPPVP